MNHFTSAHQNWTRKDQKISPQPPQSADPSAAEHLWDVGEVEVWTSS